MSKGPTRVVAGGARLPLKHMKVVVAQGPDKGASVDLADGLVVVGTDPDCALPLSDDSVSSRHCELSLEGGDVLLRDLGSTNGVYVGEVRVREALLPAGAKIHLGDTRLVLKAAPDEERVVSSEERIAGLYGKSAAMRALFAQLEAVSRSDAPVLVEGETGAGKEVTARALHALSLRGEGPFVLFDCGAVAGNLIEAELFGHEKGAFTGAGGARAGLAESADSGTLVLDEIGELPLDLQPKLLRLIERREVRRVGSNQTKTVNVRVVACTHRALRAEVKARRFREDLFFRLSALRLRVPALRERAEDIPGLVDRMLEEQRSPLRFAGLPESHRSLLLSYRWPGNVRELRNVVERLMVFPQLPAPGLVEVEAITGDASGNLLPLAQARDRAHDQFERKYLSEIMTRSEGSISDAARLAQVSRQFIQRLLRKHGMR